MALTLIDKVSFCQGHLEADLGFPQGYLRSATCVPWKSPNPQVVRPHLAVCPASIAPREEIVIEADIRQSRLYSEDLAPVPASGRTWGMASFAALWISLVACIPTYMLASSLIGGCMSWCGDADDLLVSGLLEHGEQLAKRAAVVEVPVGKGHLLLFAINPVYRGSTIGSHPLVWNAMLQYGAFGAGARQ
jgi:hypothetical protein